MKRKAILLSKACAPSREDVCERERVNVQYNESRNVDLKNNGMGITVIGNGNDYRNHYLKDVDHGSPLSCVSRDHFFDIHVRRDI